MVPFPGVVPHLCAGKSVAALGAARLVAQSDAAAKRARACFAVVCCLVTAVLFV